MAAGDNVAFREAIIPWSNYYSTWLGADVIKFALITTLPTATDVTPSLSDYTECTAGGDYVAGGYTLGTFATCFTTPSNNPTFADPDATLVIANNVSNPTNARGGLFINSTRSDVAVAYYDFGAVTDLSLVTSPGYTITWDVNGIFRIS